MAVKKTDVDKINKLTEEILANLNVDLKSQVSADLEGVHINLSGKDSALMIGFHGENLSALAYILGLLIRKQVSDEIHFKVDINDYLKEKDKKIRDMTQRAISKVRKSGFPEEIRDLNPYERRIAHMQVAKEGLLSESKGYGKERVFVVKPKGVIDEESS